MLKLCKDGIASLKSLRSDKLAYKQYKKRIENLPEEYRFVFEKATNYMWGLYGGGDGYDMLALQADLLELFEEGAAEKRNVLDITGKDVAVFCDELLKNTRTAGENARQKLNQTIEKKL